MYDVRSRYLATTVATAGPARLLTMLFDRLVLDVDRAESSLLAGQRPEATQQLKHAQDVVAELISSLDADSWDGGPGLLSIYGFLYSSLLDASMTGSPEQTAACRDIITPLRDAWHEAATTVAESQFAAGRAFPALQSATAGVLGVG
ncbi:MAG: flagellar protein FliS [Cellulomonas sp.]|nr:flagellar protein FliS [Cellulomonas sp.]